MSVSFLSVSPSLATALCMGLKGRLTQGFPNFLMLWSPWNSQALIAEPTKNLYKILKDCINTHQLLFNDKDASAVLHLKMFQIMA